MKNHLSLPLCTRYALTALTVLALFIISAGLSPATATPEPETATATTVDTTTVITEAEVGAVRLTLPGTPVNQPQISLAKVPKEYLDVKQDAIPLLNTNLSHAAISSYKTDTGMQTLIQIDSAKASREYRFPISLPTGTKAQLAESGAVIVNDVKGEILGGYRTPWAFDSSGEKVPTRFKLDGDTLVQTVGFTSQTTFPVIADPNSWWGWTVCVGTIAGVIAGNVFAIKYVTKIGGVAKLAKKLLEAKSDTERWAAVGAIGGYITGTNTIINACR